MPTLNNKLKSGLKFKFRFGFKSRLNVLFLNTTNTLMVSSAFLILFGIFIFFSGFSFGNNVYANTSSDTTVQLDVSSVINISTPNTATLECSSDSSGNNNGGYVCSTTTNIAVNTNNVTGYTLYMNTTSGYSNSLTHATITSGSGSNTPTIPTLSGVYTTANFPINYWGYTGGSDQSSITGGYDCTGTGSSSSDHYCPILAYNSDSTAYAPNHIIKVTDAPTVSSTVPITYLAKADNVKESGEYSTSLTYTAIANYIPNTTIKDCMILQQVDSAICSNTQPYSSTHRIYTLIDARDNTKYTVAKLADNNCWMTQNLELGEYGSPMTLTNQLSNVGPDGYTLNFAFANNSIYKGNSNHYGNYYNFSQATAGSATTSTEGDALYSICPKNWRLPSAGNSDATSSEFYIMLNNYITTGSWIEDIEGYSGHWEGVTISQFTNAPISIVFSGLVNSETVAGQGTVVRLWSSTPQVSTRAAFDLYANAGGGIAVIPKNAYYRTGYLAVRCLVTQ